MRTLRLRHSTRTLLLLGATAIAGRATHAQRTSSDLAVAGLTVNADSAPLGLDDPTPRFRWMLLSSDRGVMQRSYRMRVASRAELLHDGSADVWDSRTVRTSDPYATYAGPALRPRTRYFWSVRAWGNGGRITRWSQPAWFETGLMRAAEWRGNWIAGPERNTTPLTVAEGLADDSVIRAAGEFCRPPQWLTSGFAARLVPNNQGECRDIRPAPMLRKSFQITKRVASARVYSSGLGYNELSVNGAPASASVLDPAFTDYSKTVLYTTHDVTSLLRAGENVIASVLGSGRFDDAARSWDWGWDRAQWRATPRLRLDLHITYTDGSEQVVVSDTSWRVSVEGPTRYDSYYLGETYDARREIPGWNAPGFRDSTWSAARIVGPPFGVVRTQTQEPIRVVSVRTPWKQHQPVPGIIVYDVGQNLTGWATVSVNAPAGTILQLFYSEKLDSAGRASIAGNTLVFGQLQTDFYVANGKGRETWTPRFSYKGFQYLEISGEGGRPLQPDVSVSVIQIQQLRSDIRRTSQFASSSGTLANIHRNTIWAVQSNMHGVITDTPVYEKNAWTGDAQLTSGTASILFGTERLYTKMFQDMLDAQTAQGEVSLLAPSNQNYGYVGKPAFKPSACCGATPAWDAFWFVIPWESYQRYGNLAALAKTYPAMRLYLDEWIPRWTARDGDGFAYTLTSGLGDWVPPAGVSTVNRIASTAYYAHMARIAANAARALGKTADAARYAQLFERIRSDFNAAFLGTDGVYRELPIAGAVSADQAGPPAAQVPIREYVQTAQILPLAFGLVPDSLRASVAARLANDIKNTTGGNAYVGVLGARWVLPVLTAAGYDDVAFGAATQTDEPSWGYWTNVLGFTSLGEQWFANTRSRNHHMFGSIAQWFYEDLAGIRPVEPGYRKIEFRPAIPSAGLDSASASYESVRGTVASRWKRSTEGLELDVTVPANAMGRVYVPASGPEAVMEIGGGRSVRADQAPSVHFVGVEGGRVVYEVGSGRFRFRSRNR